jgi:hypothetical protein
VPREFIKDVGKPGTFFTDDGAVTVTDADFDEFIENFHDMQASGLEVPVPWAHPPKDDDKGYPVNAKDKATLDKRDRDRLNAGWLNDLYRDRDGNFKARVEIRRDDDISKVDEIGVFVSPQFGSWTNPITGKEYGKCVTHLALTTRPLNPKQSKEFLATTAMSLDAATAARKGTHPTVQMAGMYYDENRGQNEPDPENKNADDPANKDGKEPKKLSKREQAVCSLKKIGVILPDNWSPSDLDTLLAAAETLAAAQMTGTGEGAGKGKLPDKPTKTRTEPTVLVMSIDAKASPVHAKVAQAVTDGKMTEAEGEAFLKSAGTLQFSLDKPAPDKAAVQAAADKIVADKAAEAAKAGTVQMAAAEATALRSEVTNLRRGAWLRRVDDCLKAGKCTAARAKSIKDLVGTFQFSAEKQTDPAIEAKIEAIEENTPGAAWSPEERMTQMAVKQEGRDPFFSNDGEPVSDEEGEALANTLVAKMYPKEAPVGELK